MLVDAKTQLRRQAVNLVTNLALVECIGETELGGRPGNPNLNGRVCVITRITTLITAWLPTNCGRMSDKSMQELRMRSMSQSLTTKT